MTGYQLLGPLRVVGPAGSSSISARKVGTLLAVLLVRTDRLVPADQLIAELWADRPPRRATTALHVYVSQLRKFLIGCGIDDGPLVTRGQCYSLLRGDAGLDFEEFLRAADRGRAGLRAGDLERAAADLNAALRNWRGPVLDGLRSPALDGFAAGLTGARLECEEMLVETRLRQGRHRQLVGHLYALTAEHPFCEPFHRQLMLALVRSERRADALAAYQSARRTLRAELGIEPGRPLRELRQSILDDDLRLEEVSA